MAGEKSMVSDSDGTNYPWYGSQNEVSHIILEFTNTTLIRHILHIIQVLENQVVFFRCLILDEDGSGPHNEKTCSGSQYEC